MGRRPAGPPRPLVTNNRASNCLQTSTGYGETVWPAGSTGSGVAPALRWVGDARKVFGDYGQPGRYPHPGVRPGGPPGPSRRANVSCMNDSTGRETWLGIPGPWALPGSCRSWDIFPACTRQWRDQALRRSRWTETYDQVGARSGSLELPPQVQRAGNGQARQGSPRRELPPGSSYREILTDLDLAAGPA